MRNVLLLLALLLALPATSRAAGEATVVWINVDGVRGDYVERSGVPFLSRLVREGAYTTEFVPVFPSLTFPTHLSMATGVGVSGHGVPGNSFYDTDTGRTHRFPPESELVRAEAIWNTAARQGLRAAVVDWPMSHRQDDLPHPSAYYGQRYDGSLTDAQRVENVVTTWTSDNENRTADTPPLRLLLGYMSEVDSTGHRVGPDHPDVMTALAAADAILQDVFDRSLAEWERHAGPDDEFYFLVTTDHGMSGVHTLVNLANLLGDAHDPDATIVTSGSVATVFLGHLMPDRRRQAVDAMIETLEGVDFAHAFRPDDVPADWDFSDPTRVGDLVVSLDKGYTFSSRGGDAATVPVGDNPGDADGPRGMHGYPADENPEMLGFAAFYRHRHPFGGVDVGAEPVRALLPAE